MRIFKTYEEEARWLRGALERIAAGACHGRGPHASGCYQECVDIAQAALDGEDYAAAS